MSRSVAAPVRRDRWIDRGLFFAGLLLLAYLIGRLGVEDVARHLRGVGWGIGLIIAQEIFAYAANTLGWYLAFAAPRPRIPWRVLLAARIAGDAVNYLTPTAGLGGEVVRGRMLRGYATPTVLASSVTVGKLSQFAGQVCFVVLAGAWVLPSLTLDPTIRQAIGVTMTLFVGLTLASVVAQRRGLFGPLLRLVRRTGFVHRHARLAQRLHDLDAEMARYHLDGSIAFLRSAAAFALGWACGLIEVALILWLLGIPVQPATVVAIEVLSIVLDAALFFVPAKAGTQEAGKVLIFTLLGLDPAQGLSFGLLRRVRELTWSVVGLALLRRVRPA